MRDRRATSASRAEGARSRREDGAAMVEFALVLPILMILVFGMLEFGRALNYWIDASHLSTTAARWAVVNKNPGPEATLQESIRMQANTAELRDGMQVCISFPDDATPDIGDAVKVTATYEFNWLPLIEDQIGVGSTTLTGAAQMRLEQEPSEYTAICDPA